MILSAGLTPAWQQILVFDQVRWGEVNRAREVAWCGSGKVLNAGMAAHHLGGPGLTLAPLGGLPLAEIERESPRSACRGGGSKPARPRGSARRFSTAPPAGSRNWWRTAGRSMRAN